MPWLVKRISIDICFFPAPKLMSNMLWWVPCEVWALCNRGVMTLWLARPEWRGRAGSLLLGLFTPVVRMLGGVDPEFPSSL